MVAHEKLKFWNIQENRSNLAIKWYCEKILGLQLIRTTLRYIWYNYGCLWYSGNCQWETCILSTSCWQSSKYHRHPYLYQKYLNVVVQTYTIARICLQYHFIAKCLQFSWMFQNLNLSPAIITNAKSETLDILEYIRNFGCSYGVYIKIILAAIL